MGLLSRCRRDHDKVGQLPAKLDRDGADAAGATNNQEALLAPGTGLRTSRRSKSVTQAVIAVSGTAAASACERERGLGPTSRSSTW